MILIWGIDADGPLERVREELGMLGADIVFIDQQQILETEIDLTVDRGARGTLRGPDFEVALEDVQSVYVRPYETLRMAAVAALDPSAPEVARAARCEASLVSWTEVTGALVVNRLSAMGSNSSKPYQLRLISAAGFDVPDTLLTNDRDALAEFRSVHRSVIYKSTSGIRSIVARLTSAHEDRLDDMACPTQFQEFVDGTDVRIHVVGEQVFGCEIESSADDYRYAGSGLCARPLVVPAEVAERCLGLARDLGLPVAGIDLRRRTDGRWCCFEVNPSPAFTYYEQVTGQPIARAVAKLLMARSA